MCLARMDRETGRINISPIKRLNIVQRSEQIAERSAGAQGNVPSVDLVSGTSGRQLVNCILPLLFTEWYGDDGASEFRTVDPRANRIMAVAHVTAWSGCTRAE